MLLGWTVNIGLDTYRSRKMESKAYIQRKGSNWEVRGFNVRFRPDSKEKNQITDFSEKYAKKRLLRKQFELES